MRRRSFLALLSGAAAAWPLATKAQQPGMPVVGYLSVGWPDQTSAANRAAILRGLSETGLVEGRNVSIEYRYAEGQYDRLPELAADLVRRRVSVIIAMPGAAAIAARAATTTIPIVFEAGTDPVQLGLVASFNRPGGNATGITSIAAELTAKRLGILHELMPDATRFAVLVNPNGSGIPNITTDAKAAMAAIGGQLDIPATNNREVEETFATIVRNRVDAILVSITVVFFAGAFV
jgi:putative ABC transport system substrate-binding protein